MRARVGCSIDPARTAQVRPGVEGGGGGGTVGGTQSHAPASLHSAVAPGYRYRPRCNLTALYEFQPSDPACTGGDPALIDEIARTHGKASFFSDAVEEMRNSGAAPRPSAAAAAAAAAGGADAAPIPAGGGICMLPNTPAVAQAAIRVFKLREETEAARARHAEADAQAAEARRLPELLFVRERALLPGTQRALEAQRESLEERARLKEAIIESVRLEQAALRTEARAVGLATTSEEYKGLIARARDLMAQADQVKKEGNDAIGIVAAAGGGGVRGIIAQAAAVATSSAAARFPCPGQDCRGFMGRRLRGVRKCGAAAEVEEMEILFIVAFAG
eukprot:tig00000681_g3138.t1